MVCQSASLYGGLVDGAAPPADLFGHPPPSPIGQRQPRRCDLGDVFGSTTLSNKRRWHSTSGACATPAGSDGRNTEDPPAPQPGGPSPAPSHHTPGHTGRSPPVSTCTRIGTFSSTPSTLTSPKPTSNAHIRVGSCSTRAPDSEGSNEPSESHGLRTHQRTHTPLRSEAPPTYGLSRRARSAPDFIPDTNMIESVFSIMDTTTRNVKRWRNEGDMQRRWAAAGMEEPKPGSDGSRATVNSASSRPLSPIAPPLSHPPGILIRTNSLHDNPDHHPQQLQQSTGHPPPCDMMTTPTPADLHPSETRRTNNCPCRQGHGSYNRGQFSHCEPGVADRSLTRI